MTPIHTLLRQTGLGHWTGTLDRWLQHYQGFERLADPMEETPQGSIVRLLRQLRRDGITLSDREFAQRLATLDFLVYRVRVPGQRRWNPMLQSLPDYLSGADAPLQVWKWDTEEPPSGYCRNWLLKTLGHDLGVSAASLVSSHPPGCTRHSHGHA